MPIKSYFKFVFLIIAAFALFFGAKAQAAVFDPNNIISDQEMLDADSMTLAQIEAFLKSQGGYISKNTFTNYYGETKTAAQIIYDAAHNYNCEGVALQSGSLAERKAKCKAATINPKMLIVLLQKEQSLITDQSPTQSQLDWACGYGCPDGGGCNDRWRGFGRQLNSAALQFNDYMTNPQNYGYKAGNTYTVSNTGRPSMQVTPQNHATAALYNYTPHVYNGNFNFFNLWNRYFSFSYPNNTLLQVKGEPGVWLLSNGQRRPFLSKGALTSRYDINKVVQVSKSVLEQYPVGAPIKYAQYSLIRSPRGTIFLLVDNQRRGITSQEAMRKVGFNPEEIMNASWDDINAYEEGTPITATSTYPTGALLQDKKTGGIFYVTEGTKAPLWDKILLKTKFKWKSITPVSSEKLASYQTVEPAIFNDGELLKSAISPGVYVIDNKKRRPITSGTVFESLGYSWKNVITVPAKILNLYEEGLPISDLFGTPSTDAATSTDSAATSTPSAIDTGTASSTATSTPTTASSTLDEEINSILHP